MVNSPCQFNVIIAYSVNIVCYEINLKPIVNIKPFRMVVDLFSFYCYLRHKTKRLNKVFKFKSPF